MEYVNKFMSFCTKTFDDQYAFINTVIDKFGVTQREVIVISEDGLIRAFNDIINEKPKYAKYRLARKYFNKLYPDVDVNDIYQIQNLYSKFDISFKPLLEWIEYKIRRLPSRIMYDYELHIIDEFMKSNDNVYNTKFYNEMNELPMTLRRYIYKIDRNKVSRFYADLLLDKVYLHPKHSNPEEMIKATLKSDNIDDYINNTYIFGALNEYASQDSKLIHVL